MFNIFNIWNEIGQKTPFAVRRTHWKDKGTYVIVENVVPDEKGYGTAYGVPTSNNYPNTYFQYNRLWREKHIIPNSGVYGWEYVENVPLVVKSPNDGAISYDIKYENERYQLSTTIRFGKYKNFTIQYILDKNPSYIKWALNNIKNFKVSNEVIEFLNKKGTT